MTEERKIEDEGWIPLVQDRWTWLGSTYELQNEVYGYPLRWFIGGLEIGSPAVTKQLAAYIFWNSFSAVQEIAEMNVEFSWKPWAVDEPFVNRERILDEIVDVNHFLGNILVGLGVSQAEYEAAYQKKQQKNRERAASGSYSAKKGSLGEGSDV